MTNEDHDLELGVLLGMNDPSFAPSNKDVSVKGRIPLAKRRMDGEFSLIPFTSPVTDDVSARTASTVRMSSHKGMTATMQRAPSTPFNIQREAIREARSAACAFLFVL